MISSTAQPRVAQAYRRIFFIKLASHANLCFKKSVQAIMKSYVFSICVEQFSVITRYTAAFTCNESHVCRLT